MHAEGDERWFRCHAMRACVFLVLIACGGKDTAPPAPVSNVVAGPAIDAAGPDAKTHFEEVVAAFTGFRDDMCKCADKACADAVQDRMAKWTQNIAERASDFEPQADEGTVKLLTEIGTAYGECMTKALTAGSGAGPHGLGAP
jgi:hypothetical protein